jgi:CubicO group peptidase (beta-lactamase class C family)
MGMPARDLARIGYCMLRNGKWNEEQVIPKWFVEQTSQPTHDVKTLELRFRIPAQTFSHGWELPARLTGEGGTPSGKDIPADARYKPGSGGQLIAFVPSLDLVVTRQTGSSGEWEYAEYLRRACAAVVDNQTDRKAGSNESGIAQEEDMVENLHTNQQFDWQRATPESQGMSSQKLDALRESLVAKNTKSLLIPEFVCETAAH